MRFRFPTLVEEVLLHERALRRDPTVPVDFYQRYMDPLGEVLKQDMGCVEDPAYDAAIDALLSYLVEPERYDPSRGRLCTYLIRASKNGALDRRRSAEARARNEQAYATAVEVLADASKEKLERKVEARLIVTRLAKHLKDERDQQVVWLILMGERSTEAFAKVLGLSSLPQDELRREVKRHRDRLMKVLERFVKEEPHDES